MRKLFFICFIVVLIGCEKPGDCIKSTGPMTTRVYNDLTFSKILVNKGISVVITEGDVYKVEVKTGENLINDIGVAVADGMLTVIDHTSCNWTREYGDTVVYITAPDLTAIYSKTEKAISSDGILHYPSLQLFGMDTFDGFTGVGTGDFILKLETQNLTVNSNNVCGFYLVGHADDLHVNFYESEGILHGENMVAKNIEVYHRGTNDVVVHPTESLTGAIYNIGNVISYNRPPIVAVGEYYRGKLLFY